MVGLAGKHLFILVLVSASGLLSPLLPGSCCLMISTTPWDLLLASLPVSFDVSSFYYLSVSLCPWMLDQPICIDFISVTNPKHRDPRVKNCFLFLVQSGVVGVLNTEHHTLLLSRAWYYFNMTNVEMKSQKSYLISFISMQLLEAHSESEQFSWLLTSSGYWTKLSYTNLAWFSLISC